MTMELDAASSLAVAGLVAQTIDAAAAGSVHHGSQCLNCDTALGGAFCHVCGQRVHVHKSLLHLGEEVLHGILHFDAKGLRTLPMLVLHPGQLTRRYIDGHRTRYVSPLALFLFMVFLMFFVAALTSKSGPELTDPAAARKASIEARPAALQAVERAQAGLIQAKAGADAADVTAAQATLDTACEELAELDKEITTAHVSDRRAEENKFNISGASVKTRWPAANAAIKHAAENPELTIYKLKSSGSKLSFLLVPISLPFLWLLFFWRRGVTVYDHAVFSLYSLSFMALMFVAVFVLRFAGLGIILPWLICLAPPVHMFVQLRGTYGLKHREALWRTGALLCIAATVFVLYLILILIMSMR